MERRDLHREVEVLVHDTATKRARVLNEVGEWSVGTCTENLKY